MGFTDPLSGTLKELHPKWKGLTSIVAVTAEREDKGKTSQETRYFITSLDATDPKRLGQIIRSTTCTGSWIMRLMKMINAHASATVLQAWRFFVISHLNLIKSDKAAKIGV